MRKPRALLLIILSIVAFGCSDYNIGIKGTNLNNDTSTHAIFGGVDVDENDPVSLSSIALIDGGGEQVCSGTLIASNMIVSAAHCFASFSPYYVSFGTEVPQKEFWTDDLSDRSKFPNFREIVSFNIHPDYDSSVTSDNAEELRPPNDIAIAFIADGAPSGFVPARIIAPGSSLTTDITIAGFGAFPEYDAYDPLPPRLRKVDTFIGTILTQSKLVKDGPNPGKGSCVRDSGGSIYLKTNMTDTPVVIGNVVSGPWDCSEGLGYDTDFRYYVPWIESTAGVTLSKVTINTNCNNGRLDAGEVCDGSTVNCSVIDDSYVSGTASCNAECSGYDESQCATNTEENTCIDAPCNAEDVPLSIPDNSSTGVSSYISVAGAAGSIDKVTVSVEVTHTYRGDLKLALTSPLGTQYLLHDKSGGSTNDLSINIDIATFAGENPSGQWRLLASDHANGDTGSIESWSLQLTQAQNSTCGDGTTDQNEVCDNDSKPCSDIDSNYVSGNAVCTNDCQGYDTANCQVYSPSCGDSIVEGTEICDSDSKPCSDIDSNYVSGNAVCTNDCQGYDTANCQVYSPSCGDSIVEGTEICDSDSVSCVNLDANLYESGSAFCNEDCNGYITNNCVERTHSDNCLNEACTNTDLIAIPDNNSTGITSEISVSNFDGAVSSVQVTVNITHTYRGDLRVRLVSPTGIEAMLSNKAGGGSDDLNLDLTLDDFNSTSPVGQWKLIVSDHGSQDRGNLVDWSLRLTKDVQSVCGNDIVEGNELCDGGVMSCVELDSSQFSNGTASCASDCGSYDVSGCTIIENNSSCVSEACESSDSNISIPDNSSSGMSSIINVNSFSGTLENVLLNVNIDHTYRGDLYVTLTSPQGTVKVLHNKSGGSADDLVISETLSDFNGEVPTGDFTLFISDSASRDVGILLNWSIQLL